MIYDKYITIIGFRTINQQHISLIIGFLNIVYVNLKKGVKLLQFFSTESTNKKTLNIIRPC